MGKCLRRRLWWWKKEEERGGGRRRRRGGGGGGITTCKGGVDRRRNPEGNVKSGLNGREEEEEEEEEEDGGLGKGKGFKFVGFKSLHNFTRRGEGAGKYGIALFLRNPMILVQILKYA